MQYSSLHFVQNEMFIVKKLLIVFMVAVESVKNNIFVCCIILEIVSCINMLPTNELKESKLINEYQF